MHTVTNFQLQGKACAERSLGYSPPLYRANRAKQFLGLKSRLPLTFSSSSFPPRPGSLLKASTCSLAAAPAALKTLGLCARSPPRVGAEPARGRCCRRGCCQTGPQLAAAMPFLQSPSLRPGGDGTGDEAQGFGG